MTDVVGRDAVLAAKNAALRDRPTVDADSHELPSGIDGVEVRRLTTHADARGALTPVVDIRDPFWDAPIVYSYRFSILPGRIKGWGMHELQTDRYFIVSGSVRVVLFDGREDSQDVRKDRRGELHGQNTGPSQDPAWRVACGPELGRRRSARPQLPDPGIRPRPPGQVSDRPP